MDMQYANLFRQLRQARSRGVVLLSVFFMAACTGTAARPPEADLSAAVPEEAAAPPAGGQLVLDPGGAVRFSLVPSFSKVSYRAREVLRGINFQTDAMGSTREVTGSITLEENGGIRGDDSRITVDLRTLRSDEPIRDRFIQDNTLQTEQYPTAEFQLVELRGVSKPIPTEIDVSVELLGDLTVHGTTLPATWVGSARLDGDVLTGVVSTRVSITEFGMDLPSVFRVLELEDALTLELAFQARSQVIPAP